MAMTKAERERMWRLSSERDNARVEQRAAEAKRNEALAEMDRAVARAANLRWHAVYGAALMAIVCEHDNDWRRAFGDVDMFQCVLRARALADQSERLFPEAKGGDDGK